MARRRKGRAIDGILLLDKPLEISSNQALQKVKRAFLAAKAGHTGALDPLATGMLPVCLGEATKFSQFLLDADKTYIVTAKLGVRTKGNRFIIMRAKELLSSVKREISLYFPLALPGLRVTKWIWKCIVVKALIFAH